MKWLSLIYGLYSTCVYCCSEHLVNMSLTNYDIESLLEIYHHTQNEIKRAINEFPSANPAQNRVQREALERYRDECKEETNRRIKAASIDKK